MEYVEKALPESFSLWNLDGYNRTVINTKQGKIYVYCSGGWNAKQFEDGKEIYNMKTIQADQEITSFCYWLNSIIK